MEKKFQWTIMWASKLGSENITIRTDEQAEFEELKKKYREEAKVAINPPMNTDDEKVNNFVKEYESDGNKCPKCGAQLVASTTKTGKNMLKCSTNKWDFKTKTATGCDYIKWL